MPIFAVAIGLAAFVCVVGFYFYRVAFLPKVIAPQETLRIELENERLLDYDQIMNWDRKEIKIPSPYGYHLFGFFFPVENAAGTVIFSHGITYSLYGSLKYLPIFRKHRFNLLVYDNRYHGRSGGQNCSYGYFEKYDLKAIVDWVAGRFGPDHRIGTHGESLGAAITLQHAAIDPRIAFAIADCPFSDLHQQFVVRLRADYHLPPFPLIPLCGLYARLLLGFDYRAVSPIRALGSIETPLMFIHGDKDSYVPTSMSVEMFRQKLVGPRALYLAEGAKHADALKANRSMYQAEVDKFLASIGLIRAGDPG